MEGYYLGKVWRTGEAVIGCEKGVVKSGTIRRVGGHRRWDGEGLGKVRGVPWKWKPEEEEEPMKVRWLTEEEKTVVNTKSGESKVYRMR